MSILDLSILHLGPDSASADVNITESHARLHDATQMAAFLQPIPNADRLEALLMERGVVSTRAYDDAAMVARFVRSNGESVACYTVENVTIDESEMIAAQCELLNDWNVESFTRAVHVALDPTLTPASGLDIQAPLPDKPSAE